MQSRFTKKAQEALDHASEAAVMLGHSYIGSEHLLIGLIQTEECLASAVLAEYDVTDEKIINLVYQLIAPEGAVGVKEPTGYTPRVRRILENSAKEAIRFKADLIGTEHILISIIKESECVAARLLNTIGVNIKKLYVDILIAMGEDANSYKEDFHSKTKKGKTSTQTLDQYSRDLTELARQGKLDPVIGREEEINRVIQILSRRTKNNPCLIGEPGVGKTAIAEGLAAKIIEGNVPETIKDKRLLTLDLSGMVAGSKYRGEFEERIKKVISEVKAAGNILLFLDELHTIIGAGGAARAIAFLCAGKKASEIYIMNRTLEKAQNIADAVNEYAKKDIAKAAGISECGSFDKKDYIVIQTTSVGLHPHDDETAVTADEFYENAAAGVDIIYNPYETMFMKLMKKHGKPAYNGLKMLLYQGVAAYELWNDCKISSDMADIIYEDMKKELGISE